MADDVDVSEAAYSRWLEQQIAAKRVESLSELKPIGVCYNCEAVVADGHKFCDKDCAEDFNKRVNRRFV